MCVLALSTEFCCLEENPDEQSNQLDIQRQKQRNLGVGKRQCLTNFKGSLVSSNPARECIYDPSYPYTNLTELTMKSNRFLLQSFNMSSYWVQLTKILTTEGDVFGPELTFGLLGVSFPIL